MMPSEARFTELSELLAILFDGELAQPQRERLEALLLDNPDAQDFYWQLVALDSEMEWRTADCPPCLPFGLAAKEDVEAGGHGAGASEATAIAKGGMMLGDLPVAATNGARPPSSLPHSSPAFPRFLAALGSRMQRQR